MARKFKFVKGKSLSEKCKEAPEEISLGSFLAEHIEEARQLEEADLQERKELQAFRENKSKYSDPHTLYAMKNKNFKPPEKAFRIFIKHNPKDACLIYADGKFKARYRGGRYFNAHYHPDFMGKFDIRMINQLGINRRPELDQYFLEGQAPIPQLLKAGFTFPCACCHEHAFTLEDYENKRCFVLEGEGNPIDFAKGFVLCYSCYQKLG